MAIKKLKHKDIFTKEMGDPPENNDMGSATMGAGAGRGKQGGPTAKELSDYSRKQERKRSGDRVFMAEDGQPPKNKDMSSEYAKGGMARNKGMHKMPDGKMMKNSAMMNHGGSVSSSSRGNGIAVRGKTKGRLC